MDPKFFRFKNFLDQKFLRTFLDNQSKQGSNQGQQSLSLPWAWHSSAPACYWNCPRVLVGYSYCCCKGQRGWVIPKFQIFPNLIPLGWGCQIFAFYQIQNKPYYPGGRVKENFVLFPLFGTILVLNASLPFIPFSFAHKRHNCMCSRLCHLCAFECTDLYENLFTVNYYLMSLSFKYQRSQLPLRWLMWSKWLKWF